MKIISIKHDFKAKTSTLYFCGMPLLTKRRYTGGGGNGTLSSSGVTYLFDKIKLFSTLSLNERENVASSFMVLCDGAGSDFGRGMSDVRRIDKLLSGLDEASKDLVRSQLSDCIGAYEIDPRFCYKVSLSGTEIESLRALRNFRHQIAEVEVFNEATGEAEKAYTWGGLYLPHNFFEYQVIFYRHSLHLFKNLDRTKAVLDCGACLGDSSLVFEKLCGFSGEIHAFEPTRRNFALMQRTIALNNLQRVRPVNLGVGNEKGSVFIENSDLGNVGASKITRGGKGVESK